jgi:hypothetical protein
MKKMFIRIIIWLAAGLPPAGFPSQTGSVQENCRYFFGFGKSKITDAVPMKQRGCDAVQSISDRLTPMGFSNRLLLEPVVDFEEYVKNPAPFTVTSDRVKTELETCRKSLHEEDAIIIYSHTHGLKGSAAEPGGLGLDDRGLEPWKQRTYLDWPNYAEQLLSLPAKTVVVLTMACHSGALVDYLNTDEKAKSLWQTRKESGRNFLVITSQDAESLSNPRRIDGEVINPFTYAIRKALDGKADGYRKGGTYGHPDGKITLGELADFIPDETRKYTRTGDESNDPKPRITGSFDPETVIAELPPPKN